MKWSCFFVLFAVARCCDDHNELLPKIAGGRVTTIDQVPYIAQIIDEDDTFCGASIISNYWLITAAHCFSGRTDEEKRTFKVTTGSSISFAGEKHDIRRIIPHPSYNSINQYNDDIALILLEKPIIFNKKQQPIGISYSSPKIGKIMTVSGYGWESERKKRRRRRRKRQYERRLLKTLDVKIVDQKLCSTKYNELWVKIPWNSFCATSGRIDSTCVRDSGGPGIIDNKLAGIVSGGYRCKSNEFPNVYTRVYRYVDWIRMVQSTVY